MSEGKKDQAPPAEGSPFRWKHDALNRLCAQLPSFGSAHFVAPASEELDFLWAQVVENLLPSAIESGLAAEAFVWSKKEAQVRREAFATQLIDAYFVRIPSGNERELDAIRQDLASWPCGLVVFSGDGFKDWESSFDFQVELKGGKARVRLADGTTGREQVCVLLEGAGAMRLEPAESPKPRAAAVSESSATSGPRSIGLVGLGPATSKLIESVLRKEGFVVQVTEGAWSKNAGQPSLVVASSDALDARESVYQIAPHAPLIVLSGEQVRQEDRVEIYRSGATAILPKGAPVAEIMAAVLAQLKLGNSELDPFRVLDEEFARLSLKLRRDVTWKFEDVARAERYYAKLIENLFKRSILTRSPVGAIVVEIDVGKVSGSVPNKVWARAMLQNLVRSVTSSLRKRDVTLLVGQRLIILSHPMSGMIVRSVLKRMREFAHEMGEPQLKSWIHQAAIPSHKDVSQATHSLFADLFAEKSLASRPGWKTGEVNS